MKRYVDWKLDIWRERRERRERRKSRGRTEGGRRGEKIQLGTNNALPTQNKRTHTHTQTVIQQEAAFANR